jgi:hypothetical protein
VNDLIHKVNPMGENDSGFLVLVSVAEFRIKVRKIIANQSKKYGSEFIKGYQYITQYENTPFFLNESISIKNESNDQVTWDITCQCNDEGWRVYGGIFVSMNKADNEIEIHSFSEKSDLKSSLDAMQA